LLVKPKSAGAALDMMLVPAGAAAPPSAAGAVPRALGALLVSIARALR